MIVTVTPTIMDGTVVRWYLNVSAAEYGRAVASASRNGVHVDGWLHDLDGTTILDDARTVWKHLAADSRADVSHWATHRQVRGVMERIDGRADS